MKRFGLSVVCFGAIHCSKTRSLTELSRTGFPVVPTLCFDVQCWPGLERLRAAAFWPEQLSLYVRICFDSSEYPHSFFRICTWDELQQTVHILTVQASQFTKKPCDITIQPHLIERLGGAVAALDDMLIIEAVDGNARYLLREGHFSDRVILSGGKVAREIRGRQSDAIFWSKGRYQYRPANQITWQDIKVLSTFSYIPSTLYEFCVTQKGEPLFLEAKALPKGTFFFGEHGRFTVYSSDSFNIQQSFPLPSLSLRGYMKHNQLHIFYGGAYLSHLSLFAASKQIPMYFSRQT